MGASPFASRVAGSMLAIAALVTSGCSSPERNFGSASGTGGAVAATSGSTGAGASGSGGAGASGAGEPCSRGGECTSTWCADGVCCDAVCGDPCMACAARLTGIPDGTCGPALDATDPRRDCEDEGAASCHDDGQCDGHGACRLYAAGTECTPPSCTMGVKTLARTCDGRGTCQSNGTEPCVPAACAGPLCAGDCTDDSACASTEYGDKSTGDCTTKKPAGTSCQGQNECTSTYCVDGVCCATACGAECRACSAAKKGGGQDGTCGDIVSGSDPDNECADQGAPSCGTDGVCGGGSCELYAQGTQCAPASCSMGVLKAKTCNGSGSCIDGALQSCAPYGCSGSQCKTSCQGDGDCDPASFCNAPTCTPKQANGQACLDYTWCTSGYCIDGYCCDQLCQGLCQACSTIDKGYGPNGTCGNIDCQDPSNECSGTSVCWITGGCGSPFCP